jgi:hypothetical protein
VRPQTEAVMMMRPPAGMVFHGLHHLAGDVVGADHVDLDDSAEGRLDLLARLENRRDAFQAGVVDQHVEGAQAAHLARHRRPVGDIANNGADLSVAVLTPVIRHRPRA